MTAIQQAVHQAVDGMNAQLSACLPQEQHTFPPEYEAQLLARLNQSSPGQVRPMARRRARVPRRRLQTWAAAMLAVVLLAFSCSQTLVSHSVAYQEGEAASCLKTSFSVPFSGLYTLRTNHEVDEVFHQAEFSYLPEGVELTECFSPIDRYLWFDYQGDGWFVFISQQLCNPDGSYSTLDFSREDHVSMVEHRATYVLEATSDNHDDIRCVKLVKELGCYLIFIDVERTVDGQQVAPEELIDTAYAILDGCTIGTEIMVPEE